MYVVEYVLGVQNVNMLNMNKLEDMIENRRSVALRVLWSLPYTR